MKKSQAVSDVESPGSRGPFCGSKKKKTGSAAPKSTGEDKKNAKTKGIIKYLWYHRRIGGEKHLRYNRGGKKN